MEKKKRDDMVTTILGYLVGALMALFTVMLIYGKLIAPQAPYPEDIVFSYVTYEGQEMAVSVNKTEEIFPSGISLKCRTENGASFELLIEAHGNDYDIRLTESNGTGTYIASYSGTSFPLTVGTSMGELEIWLTRN